MSRFDYDGIVYRMAKLLIILAFLYSWSVATLAGEGPIIAVAANMSNVMSEIIDQYQSQTEQAIRVSYGSSGNFTRQLIQGAPYELFLTADKKYADVLNESGNIINKSNPYVLGRIAFFVPVNSSIEKSENLAQVVDALQFTQYRRIAIANPEHAPYGVAAQQALQQAGIWTILRKRLLLAENAAQAAQFALAGGIDLAVIPYSFMQEDNISRQGTFFLIPASWHEPIRQYLLLTREAGPAAKKFYHYLYSNETARLLKNYGYLLLNNLDEN